MKKLFLVSIILSLFLILFGCNLKTNSVSNYKDQNSQIKQEITLYFTNEDNSKLLSETREVSVNDKENLPVAVIEELLKGPTDNSMKKVIPEGTKLLDIKQKRNIVTVDFSDEYYNTEFVSEIVARFSVVNTLCDIEGIDKVKLLVESKELTNSDGEPFGYLGKEDAVFDVNSSEKNTVVLKLYFSEEKAEYLTAENRVVEVKENEPIEKYVMEELIKGPESEHLFKTIPEETKLISIETKEGICFVNLSQEFVSKHWGGTTGEIMTIYSVVNSLTELPDIDKVQFLIEGHRVEVFKHLIFNEPFERDDKIIKD